MSKAKQYRAKAAEFTKRLKATSVPAETREFRRLEQSYFTLAENEEWMAANREKTNRPAAGENWYGDIFSRREKLAPGSPGAADTIKSTGLPTMIQQLFDDAGAMGGMVQTATLRGRIARFLQKHKDENFP
jgi:hypothetical protein